MGEPVTSVDFHFDVMCPWAYQASVWMRDVRDRLGLEVRWRFFTLEEINRAEGKKHPWEREWSYGWGMMRVGALLRRIDPGRCDRWYLAAGTALHVEGHKPHRREVAAALHRPLGLDPAWWARPSPTRAPTTTCAPTTDGVIGLGGFGVPTLVFGSTQALFGPVLIEPPSGEAAIRLWQLLTGWLEFPNLYEVQRPKRPADMQAIATTFQPYLEARDWVTVQKETP